MRQQIVPYFDYVVKRSPLENWDEISEHNDNDRGWSSCGKLSKVPHGSRIHKDFFFCSLHLLMGHAMPLETRNSFPLCLQRANTKRLDQTQTSLSHWPWGISLWDECGFLSFTPPSFSFFYPLPISSWFQCSFAFLGRHSVLNVPFIQIWRICKHFVNTSFIFFKWIVLKQAKKAGWTFEKNVGKIFKIQDPVSTGWHFCLLIPPFPSPFMGK